MTKLRIWDTVWVGCDGCPSPGQERHLDDLPDGLVGEEGEGLDGRPVPPAARGGALCSVQVPADEPVVELLREAHLVAEEVDLTRLREVVVTLPRQLAGHPESNVSN